MTHPLISRVLVVAVVGNAALAQAAEHQLQSTPPPMARNHVAAIEPVRSAANLKPTTLVYERYDSAELPRKWCYCALTMEEEIFLRQYEP